MQKIDFPSLRFENFPVVLFYRMLKAGEDVSQRFCKFKGIPLAQWNKTKDRYESETMDPAGDPEFESRRELILAYARLNKTSILLRWMLTTRKDLRPIFETLNLRWIDDVEARYKFLTTEIRKAEKKARTIAKRLEKTPEEMEALEGEASGFDIYEGLASLELVGFSIPDYNQVSVAQYVAMTKVATKKSSKSPDHGR